jgi:F0F1-type ATP synthase membrane subunit b/b'
MNIENILKLDQKALEIIASANSEISLMYEEWEKEKQQILKSFQADIEKYENLLQKQMKKEIENYKNEIIKKYEEKLNFLNFDENKQSDKIFESIKEELCPH